MKVSVRAAAALVVALALGGCGQASSLGGSSVAQPSRPAVAAAPVPAMTSAMSSEAVPRAPVASGRPGLAALAGTTWYLVGWNTGLTNGVPMTDQHPTLVFADHQSSAATVITFDGASSVTRTVTVVPDVMTWGPVPVEAAPHGSAAAAVRRAMTTVLRDATGWQLTGDQLRMENAHGGDALTFVSIDPRTAAPAKALLGKKWYLAEVDRNDHRWTPGVVSTLEFANISSADTHDGSNDTSWLVTLAAGTVTWKQLESTAASEGPLSLNVMGALVGVLKGTTQWSVSGDSLVLTGADGSTLSYTGVQPSPPGPYSGAYVMLDNNPPGGAVAGGQTLSLISGEVTISDSHGATAWLGQVAVDYGGDSKLPPGPYTITAVVKGGTCAPLPVTIVANQVGEFYVICRTTQPTAAQH